MKNLKTLFVPLMACSFLVGCGNGGGGGGGGDEPEAPTFSVTESTVEYDSDKNQAVVNLCWTPENYSLIFTEFSFTGTKTEVAKVAPTKETISNPLEIAITFANDLTESEQGTLNFHYVDKTVGIEGDGAVENICITFTRPTPEVDDDGIKLTYMRMNAGKGSKVGFSCDNTKGELKVYWGDGTVNSETSHTYNNAGKYHIYITGDVDKIALNDIDGNPLGADNRYITNIVFSNYVTTIAKNAFKAGKVSTIQSVLIPKTVTSIGEDAFTTSKAKIYCFQDKRNDGWDANCFNGVSEVVSGLRLYMMPDSILYATYTDSNPTNPTPQNFAAVYLCCDLKLKDAVIADNIIIDDGNTNISYPVTTIWESAFYNMDTLETLVVPNSVTAIDGYAFVDCKNLKNITLSNTLKTIGSNVFKNTAITSITLPRTIESIGSNAFSDCKQLTSVKFEGDDTNKSSYKKLDSNIFSNCPNINSFELAEGLETFKSYAFDHLAITELVLPSTVTALDSYIVNDCSSFETVDATKFDGSTHPIPSGGDHPYAFYFANRGKTVTIKIHSGLTEDDFVDKNWPSSCPATPTTTGIEYVTVTD